MTQKQWEKEIAERHPIITYFPKKNWARVARFNGYLPLPPERKVNR